MRRLLSGLGLALSALVLVAQPVLADDVYDPNQINYETNNNIIFRNNGDGDISAICEQTDIPPTTTKLDSDTLNNISAVKEDYVKAANQTGIRWEVFASLDYREDNNNIKASMLGGEPLGQQAVDSKYKPTTKLESIIDGAEILMGKQSIYGVDPTQPMTFKQLQEAFVTYNRGNSYARAGVSPDLSPYVMNQFDDAHKNMTFPSLPGETLAGRTETGRYGAMTVYANLVANDVSCIGAGVGAKVDYSKIWKVIEAGTLPDNLLCTPRPDEPGFQLLVGPACDSFKALDAAYKAAFGVQMPVGQGYRTKTEQINCGGYEGHPIPNSKCNVYHPNQQPPSHLWGTSIDFSGQMADASTNEHKWAVENGPKYGWFWPLWAQEGHGGNGDYVEDWHFDYFFAGHDPSVCRDDIEGLTCNVR